MVAESHTGPLVLVAFCDRHALATPTTDPVGPGKAVRTDEATNSEHKQWHLIPVDAFWDNFHVVAPVAVIAKHLRLQ